MEEKKVTLKGYCNSERCSVNLCDKYIKEATPDMWNCPWCGSALFWKRIEKKVRTKRRIYLYDD